MTTPKAEPPSNGNLDEGQKPTTLQGSTRSQNEPLSNGNLNATQEPRKLQSSSRSQNGAPSEGQPRCDIEANNALKLNPLQNTAPFESQPRCNTAARFGNNLRTCLSSDISGGHLWGQTLRIHQSQAASPVWSVRPTNQHATSESGKTRPWQSCWAPKTRPQSPPLQTAKCSGTAAPNGQRRTSKTRKRSGTAAPNDPKKKKEAPEPTPQDSETQRHGGPKRPKTDQEPPNRETQRHGGPKRAKNTPKTERYGGRKWGVRHSFRQGPHQLLGWAGLVWAELS